MGECVRFVELLGRKWLTQCLKTTTSPDVRGAGLVSPPDFTIRG